jgi:5-methylcytosine-specific restriction endonuclease McrA
LHPETEALPFIDENADAYRITWINTDRVSPDWKVKLYEQADTGRQFAIYARESTIVRLEHMVSGLVGVQQLTKCPVSHGLNAGFSRFKGGMGVCVSVDSKSALRQLLDIYFSHSASPTTLTELSSTLESEVVVARARSRAERLARLAKAQKKPRKVTVSTTAFIRNPDVVAEVLYRAGGVCESCKSPAPFQRASTGDPYLEVHHRIMLAADGDDTVDNAIALCPNCHRKSHYG